MTAHDTYVKANGAKAFFWLRTTIIIRLTQWGDNAFWIGDRDRDSNGLLMWRFWMEPNCDDDSSWESPQAKWIEGSCWNVDSDCDPTWTMKRNFIMKPSWDDDRPWDSPKDKWNERSSWYEGHDYGPTSEMKRGWRIKPRRKDRD